MQGVIPIIFTKEDNSSYAYNNFSINNVFIPTFCGLNNLNMAVVVQWLERTVVVRKTGVRLSPPAFSFRNFGGQDGR